MFVGIYGLDSHLKYSSKVLGVSWRKNTKLFPYGALLFCVVHETFTEVPLYQETSPAPKDSWLRPLIWEIFSNFLIFCNLFK